MALSYVIPFFDVLTDPTTIAVADPVELLDEFQFTSNTTLNLCLANLCDQEDVEVTKVSLQRTGTGVLLNRLHHHIR